MDKNTPPSIMIAPEDRERYLNEFNKIKAKYPEPKDRIETMKEREERIDRIYKEMGRIFVMEERGHSPG